MYLFKLINLQFQAVSFRCLLSVLWPSLFLSSVIGVITIVMQFILPLIILLFCYGRIIWMLRGRINSNFSNNGNKSDKFQTAKKNTIETFLLVTICFVICWSNNQINYLMYNLGYYINFNNVYFKFRILMVFINCTINPFIYLIKYQDYKVALKAFIGYKKSKSKDEESQLQQSTVLDTSISNSLDHADSKSSVN